MCDKPADTDELVAESDEQEAINERAEDLVLENLHDLKERVARLESDRLGEYLPSDPDEQRRSWIISQFANAELDIDINLEQMHKADTWLKTGKLPRRRKPGPLREGEEGPREGGEGTILQLVKHE